MKNPFKTFSKWNKNRWETRGVSDWERQRAKGKWLFVLKFTLVFTLALTVGLSLFDYLVDGRIKTEDFWVEVPINLMMGLIAGSIIWNTSEKKYQKFISEKSEAPYFEQIN